jgi:hypothetical protein
LGLRHDDGSGNTRTSFRVEYANAGSHIVIVVVVVSLRSLLRIYSVFQRGKELLTSRVRVEIDIENPSKTIHKRHTQNTKAFSTTKKPTKPSVWWGEG